MGDPHGKSFDDTDPPVGIDTTGEVTHAPVPDAPHDRYKSKHEVKEWEQVEGAQKGVERNTTTGKFRYIP